MPAPAVEFSLIVTEPAGGLATIIDRIHVFAEHMQKKGARAAARKAMVPVRDDARARAKVIDDENTNDPSKPDYSIIWQNIVINESARGGRRIGGIVMRVGVRGGALSKVERTLAGGVGRRASGRIVKVFRPIKKAITHPGGDTRHWRFVELGTKDIAARPFMRPALENNIGKVMDELVKEFDVQIGKMAAFVGPHQR